MSSTFFTNHSAFLPTQLDDEQLFQIRELADLSEAEFPDAVCREDQRLIEAIKLFDGTYRSYLLSLARPPTYYLTGNQFFLVDELLTNFEHAWSMSARYEFDPQLGKLKSYVGGVVLNQFRELQRMTKGHTQELPEGDLVDEYSIRTSRSSCKLLQAEAFEEFERRDPKSAELLRAHYEQQIPWRVLADWEGISEALVRQRAARAKREIREICQQL